MKKLICITVLWCLSMPLANAALALDRTRIIFPEQSKLETVRVKNPSTLPYLSQAWMSDEYGEEMLEPFMVVPPVVRIESNDYALLRIEKVGDTSQFPANRESLFYFHVREVPPKNQHEDSPSMVGRTGGSIQFAIESVIKMFYRPAQLGAIKNVDLAVAKGTRIEQKNNQVWIENSSPFYATYFSVTDENRNPVKGFESIMLKPYSREKLSIAVKPGYLITNINDYGALIINQYRCSDQVCQFVERIKQE